MCPHTITILQQRASKPKVKRSVMSNNLKTTNRSPVVERKGKSVLQQPQFIRRMQMEEYKQTQEYKLPHKYKLPQEYKQPQVPQKTSQHSMFAPEFNQNNIIWTMGVQENLKLKGGAQNYLIRYRSTMGSSARKTWRGNSSGNTGQWRCHEWR